MQPVKPGYSIVVVERDPMLHFFNVCRWMEVVRVEEDPMQAFRKLLSHSRLPRTGYAHEDDCARMVTWHKELNILFNLCHTGPAYKHQKHSVQQLKFDVPTVNLLEASADIHRIKSVPGDDKHVEQLSAR
jgi:hypothetical protein